MKHLSIMILVAASLCDLSVAARAANENTTIVMHAQPVGSVLDCGTGEGAFDCENTLPVTTVAVGEYVAVFVYLRNYDAASAITALFEVVNGGGPAPWGDWTIHASLFNCQPNMVGTLPGPTAGLLSVGFDCLLGGGLELLGWILGTAGSSGCLTVVDAPGVWGIDSCSGGVTPVALENRGSVCVGTGGYDACASSPAPVLNDTWGAIKDQYKE